MGGLHLLGAEMGFDWASVLKGTAQAFSGQPSAEQEKAKLQAQAAERKASMIKLGLIAGALVIGVGGIAWAVAR